MAADTTNDGHLDEKELCVVLEELYTQLGKGWISKYRATIQTEVHNSVLEFDKNGDGVLSLDEFKNMLQQRPWSLLLTNQNSPEFSPMLAGGSSGAPSPLLGPAMNSSLVYHAELGNHFSPSKMAARMEDLRDVDAGHSQAEVQHHNVVASRAAVLRSTARDAAAAAAMRAVAQAFRDADTDGSGFIEADELVVAMKALKKRLGEAHDDETSMFARGLHVDAKEAFELFDSDGDGLLSQEEFLVMVRNDPWAWLLPADGREALRVQQHQNYPRRQWNGPPGRAALKARVAAEIAHADAVAQSQEERPPVLAVAVPEEAVVIAQSVCVRVEPKSEHIRTIDGREIEALFLDCPAADRESVVGVVVLFQSAGMLLEDNMIPGKALRDWADWYRVHGLRCLIVSTDSAGTTELEQYATAQASVDHVQNRLKVPKESIVLHGVAFGAALAAAAAQKNVGVKCTMDQTFVSAGEICELYPDLVASILPSNLLLRRRFEVVAEAHQLPRGQVDTRLPGYRTDLFNNEQKAARIVGEFCVLGNTMAEEMRPDYALRLFDSYYQIREGNIDRMRSERLIQFHSSNKCFCHDPVASSRYLEYLCSIGLSRKEWNVSPEQIEGYHALVESKWNVKIMEQLM